MVQDFLVIPRIQISIFFHLFQIEMAASFESLLTPGFQHCAEQIFSYLDLEDLKQCSLVSTKCNDIIFKQFSKDFHREIEDYRNDPNFHTRYPGWLQVFEYVEELGDFYKLCVFRKGVEDITNYAKLDERHWNAHWGRRFTYPAYEACENGNIEFVKILIDSPIGQVSH